MTLDIVILAAGKGTRMKSDLPKVLHKIAGRSMLSHVIETSNKLAADHLHIVTGHGANKVTAEFSNQQALNFIKQQQQLGTGHALQQCLPYLQSDSVTLILYGDVPMISTSTLKKLLSHVNEASLGLLTVTMTNPYGYGRIVRDSNNNVLNITEQKDASEAELKIQEVNTGIIAVTTKCLQKWLPNLTNNNAQGEYYLTDIIAMAVADGIAVKTADPSASWEVIGVNNRLQQAELERIYQKQYAQKLMHHGVTLLDPGRFDCRGEVFCGSDVIIDINCIFEGTNQIGCGVTIGANCYIKNATIKDNTIIHANSIIESSVVGEDCSIGPFARLRAGTILDNMARIGNFVETKKALIGKGSKVNHLSYIGDAVVGEAVNIGAGTITCNYDGVNKHQTLIGDGVFVGSNTALIAPLTIGSGATIGAGSTVNKNVAADALTLTRSPQKTIPLWQRPAKIKQH
jgi:bifunctional UDP-N-acetylglucosamine pyrophosphorylase/glucosamine-1-phosphate N-acetyltransferase